MEGYVRNKTATWRHAMKRSIGPGHEVGLDDIYEQYGEKHGLEEGEPFVEWLRSVKLKDNNVWEIIYGEQSLEEEVEQDEKAADLTSPFIKKELTVEDIVTMSVRKAREDLNKITDIALIKYAYGEARQLANKDTLCRMLKKRIQVLEITRR